MITELRRAIFKVGGSVAGIYNKFYWDEAPKNTTLPYAVCTKITGVTDSTMTMLQTLSLGTTSWISSLRVENREEHVETDFVIVRLDLIIGYRQSIKGFPPTYRDWETDRKSVV